jgi:hypothetical protein
MSITITITGKTFLTDGVKVGDEVVVTSITNPSATGILAGLLLKSGVNPVIYDKLLVTEVSSETAIKFDAYLNGVALGMTAANLNITTGEQFTFNVVHHLSKDEQAAEVAAVASSYGSKRVVYVWPPEADWDGNGTLVNGSVIAAATAAAISAYPAQQSFTNLGFAGPNTLHYSNTYFSPAQLDVMSNAGVFVLVQDAPGGQVYARHQKTTSTASIQEQEFSITKAVDKLSLDLGSLVKPFIGKYNITQDLLTQLDDVLKQYLFAAKTNKAPYCGSLIIDYSQLVIRANLEGQNQDLAPGTVEIAVTVEVGYPANYINVKIFVK